MRAREANTKVLSFDLCDFERAKHSRDEVEGLNDGRKSRFGTAHEHSIISLL